MSKYNKKTLLYNNFLFIFIGSIVLLPLYFARPLSRYFMYSLPIIIIWAAKGIETIFYFLKDNYLKLYKIRPKIREQISIVLCSLIFVGFIPNYDRLDAYDSPYEYKQVGLWIKDNLGTDKNIMAISEMISFYAERKPVIFPYGEFEDIIEHAKEQSVDYIIADNRLLPRYRPNLHFLLYDSCNSNDLEKIYVWDKRAEYKIHIYKLNKE